MQHGNRHGLAKKHEWARKKSIEFNKENSKQDIAMLLIRKSIERKSPKHVDREYRATTSSIWHWISNGESFPESLLGRVKIQTFFPRVLEQKQYSYRVSKKKVLHKSEEKMHKKLKMTSQRAENLVHAQQHHGKSFYKKIFL